MNKKPIIGLDLDDVLIDFNRALCAYHNEVYSTSHKWEDMATYALQDFWGCTREEAIQKIKDFYVSEHRHTIPPVEGAVEAVTKLKEKYSLVVVTARPDHIKEKTLEWMDKHFANSFDGTHFLGFKGGGSQHISKVDICNELGLKVFVEDSLTNAQAIATPDRHVFLFNAPWNQGELPETITRVYSWNELLEKLEKMDLE